jgi:hypothetical protein
MLAVTPCLRRAAPLAAAALIMAPSSRAEAQIGACPAQPAAQVFLPWSDPAWYASVPDGGLESGGAAWTLRGPAAVVSGNEPYRVRAASDARALRLAPTASAASPASCVGPGHPTLRFFVRSENSALTALNVSVEFVDPTGASRSVPIGVISPTPAWQPSPVLPVIANTLSPALPQQARFRFTTSGDGAWYVDDVYVDPYGKG